MDNTGIEAQPSKGKALKSLDIFLGLICILFFMDTAIPVASMGSVAIFWTVVIALLFYLPSSLVVAEMGSTYPADGGMYAWVKRASGEKWGARMVWFYWVNNAIWTSSLSTFIIGVFTELFMPGLGYVPQRLLTVAFIWLLIFVCLRPMRQFKWIQNISALLKVTLVVGLVIAALAFLVQNGGRSSNPFNDMFRPNMEQALTYLPALIYNFIGFEVICSMGGSMVNPARDVPRAAIGTALIVSVLYILTSASLLITTPLEEINLVTGIMDAFSAVIGDGILGQMILFLLGVFFLYTLIAQSVSWIVGASYMAAAAAKDGELPRAFGRMHRKHGTPLGTLLITGCIATTLITVFSFNSTSTETLYWMLFSLTAMICLLPYLINFQAYLKLRRIDPDTPRPYRFPGSFPLAAFFVRLSQFFILFSILLFIWVPGSAFDPANIPLIVGFVFFIVLGEVLITWSMRAGRRQTGE
jgi:amino acid transporter